MDKLGLYEAFKRLGAIEPMYREKWSGRRPDGEAVFTIWQEEIAKENGEWVARWRGEEADSILSAQRAASADKFLKLAAENIGKPCRFIMVMKKAGTESDIDSCELMNDRALIPLEADAETLTFRGKVVPHVWC